MTMHDITNFKGCVAYRMELAYTAVVFFLLRANQAGEVVDQVTDIAAFLHSPCIHIIILSFLIILFY